MNSPILLRGEQFEVANKIMTNIMRNHDGISDLTENDRGLYYRFFETSRYNYGNGWSYINQAMNSTGSDNRGYKYYNGKNLISITAYPRFQKPDEYAVYFIRPMGPEAIQSIISITKVIRRLYPDMTIFVKKIFSDQKEKLIEYGFREIEAEPWHTVATAEDDTFDEIIIGVLETKEELQNQSRKKSLKQTYAAVRKLKAEQDVRFTEENFEEKAWDITTTYFKEVHRIKTKVNVSTPFDYYNLIFRSKSDKFINRELLFINNEPLGYYISERSQSNKYTNLYAMLTLRHEFKGLGDLIVTHLLDTIETPYLNLGGSEDEWIDRFKRKYKPVETLQIDWAVLPCSEQLTP